MGDMADMILDGTLDSETGELIDGDSPGFPRTKYGNIPGAQQVFRGSHMKPHACQECGKRFKKMIGLKAHMKDVHED